ncbi:MAG TPA: hypothetical protein VIP06_02980 [Nocardioides sp.]
MPAQQSGAQALVAERNLVGKASGEQATAVADATSVVVQELADQGSVDWTTLTIAVTRSAGGWLVVDAQATVMLGASRGTR